MEKWARLDNVYTEVLKVDLEQQCSNIPFHLIKTGSVVSISNSRISYGHFDNCFKAKS